MLAVAHVTAEGAGAPFYRTGLPNRQTGAMRVAIGE